MFMFEVLKWSVEFKKEKKRAKAEGNEAVFFLEEVSQRKLEKGQNL